MLAYLPSVRENVSSIAGSALAWTAVITANQQQLEYWLRIASLVGALAASVATVWNVLRKKGSKS